MPKKKKDISAYSHRDKKRVNNPPAGLVDPNTDPDTGKKKVYEYDPHIDPSLQWAGKAERTSFEVPIRSLHVHEHIDPHAIMEAVKKSEGGGGSGEYTQGSLFESERDTPLREAIEFYKHKNNWTNRLISGDSLLVMNSLLQKENMAGKVQCVYMDPPYGIKYGSNFQPFTNKREVKDGKGEDLTSEPEMIKAFRDTWELGIHSYLSYMRDRLLLAKDLLTDSGSVFVQISDENVHHIREIMDEVFGAENFVTMICYQTRGILGSSNVASLYDLIIWYSKNKDAMKFRQIFMEKDDGFKKNYPYVIRDGEIMKASEKTLLQERVSLDDLNSSGLTPTCVYDYFYKDKVYKPRNRKSWRTNKEGMTILEKEGRLVAKGGLYFLSRFTDFPVSRLTNMWKDLGAASGKQYVVQTNAKVIQRCILMATDPGDLVFDPTCGSGTTAYVAEQWGRRWITCDTSRVALTLAKQRLMTATFDYYKLAYPDEGVGSGFEYKKVPHITLKSIANNEPPQTEALYDQPFKDTKRARVTGPFTVEAVPAPAVKPIGDIADDNAEPLSADASVARGGETLRQSEWRDELLKTGIRAKSGQRISFSRVETVPHQWLHAEAETKPDDSDKDSVKEETAATYKPSRVVVSFGPEHAPLEQRQVENAIQEAQDLVPKPNIVVFAAFQFDPEAAKDIDQTKWPGVTILKAQMNADMQTHDLTKERSSDDSFWLVGQPDIKHQCITKGPDKGKWKASIHGFDYFNTKTGKLESGDEKRIAVWMLDTDYDGRALYPRQVFFPLSSAKDGWDKLAKTLKAEIDEELIEAYRGTESLPFELGDNRTIAVKIVDDRGIESLKVIKMAEEE